MQRVRWIIRHTWVGLAGVAVSIAAATAVSMIWGPLWGTFGFRYVASALMVFCFFVLVGLEEFFRAPNPYTRVHPLFGLQDLGPAGDLKSSDPALMLACLPLLIGVVIILLSAWL